MVLLRSLSKATGVVAVKRPSSSSSGKKSCALDDGKRTFEEEGCPPPPPPPGLLAMAAYESGYRDGAPPGGTAAVRQSRFDQGGQGSPSQQPPQQSMGVMNRQPKCTCRTSGHDDAQRCSGPR
ncbi:hypothetical protein MRX96_038300 [Rhipicephalus microplus]